MKLAGILDDLQAIQKQIDALYGLMDMAAIVSEQQPHNQGFKYMGNVATAAHSLLDDIEASMNETASALMVGELEAAEA